MPAATVYVTAANMEEARSIARTMVNEKLAACANILGEISSVYVWQGDVQEDREMAIILKTRQDLVDALTSRIKEIHSYDCPCVTAHPVTGGNVEFLEWIASETA